MVALYDDELNVVLDRLLPTSQFVGRQRPTDPWFDKECRDAKRRLERAPAAAVAAHDDYSRTATSTAVFHAAAAKAARYNQRRLYHQLRLKNSSEFWGSKIEADQSDPRKLWKTVDILGRGRLPPSSAIDVSSFNRFFAEKVAKYKYGCGQVRSNAPSPTFSCLQSGASFCYFRSVTVDDVIRWLPDKSSPAVPIPTSVLKQVSDVMAPFIAELFSRLSMTSYRGAGRVSGQGGQNSARSAENFFSFAHPGFQFAHPAIRNGCPPCPPYRG